MKKILFFGLMLSQLMFQAQAFTQDFEEAPPENWTYINNGSTNANEQWGYWTGYFTMTPHSGSLMAGIQYSSTTTHNDYLVTPKFQVIEGVSDKLSFYAQNYSASFQETISVKVSETTATPQGFSAVVVQDLAPSTGVWTKYEYDLSAFVGKEIYVAFHSGTFFKWFVGLDDVAVFGSDLAASETGKNNISLYPNPFKNEFHLSQIKNVKSIEVSDVSGRLVKQFAPSQIVDVSGLGSGLYLIQLKMIDGSSKTIKAIKK